MRFIVVLFLSIFVTAQTAAAGGMAEALMVSGAHVRALPPSSEVTSGYLTLTNHGDEAVEIIGATSSVAKAVEFHEMSMHDGMMKMGRMDKVVAPAHGSLEFAPGGKHLMLTGLKHPLRAGETVIIELKLSDQSTLSIDAEVRDIRHQRQQSEKEHEGGHKSSHDH